MKDSLVFIIMLSMLSSFCKTNFSVPISYSVLPKLILYHGSIILQAILVNLFVMEVSSYNAVKLSYEQYIFKFFSELVHLVENKLEITSNSNHRTHQISPILQQKNEYGRSSNGFPQADPRITCLIRSKSHMLNF